MRTFKFASVGTELQGEVICANMPHRRKYGSDEFECFDNGDVKRSLVLDVVTADGGGVRVYAKYGLERVIREQLGGKLPAQGDQIRIRRIEDGEPTREGWTPPHRFTVEIAKPDKRDYGEVA
jgi:hypothetical protein